MVQFRTTARTHVGCIRKANEDAILAKPASGLWAVADGMGGHADGHLASRGIIEALDAIEPGLDADRMAQRIRLELQKVHDNLRQLGISRAPPRTIGSTVVALAADGARFSCLWAGDCRAYRLREGALSQITRDHTVVQQLVDAGLIASDEADGHQDGHIVTRALGAEDAGSSLDCVQGGLKAADAFLLCSDGLSRIVSKDLMSAALLNPDQEHGADQLLEAVLARGAPDNVSFLLITPN